MKKYIHFVLVETGVYEVLTNSDESYLGMIRWYRRWRHFVFYPEPETVFSADCLDDISAFMKKEELAQK